jgi:hypothetical protein
MVVIAIEDSIFLWSLFLISGCGAIQQNCHSGRAKPSWARPGVRQAHHPERSRRGIQEAGGKSNRSGSRLASHSAGFGRDDHLLQSLANLKDIVLSRARIKSRRGDQDFFTGNQAADHLDTICVGASAQAHITTHVPLFRFHDNEVELPHLCHCP